MFFYKILLAVFHAKNGVGPFHGASRNPNGRKLGYSQGFCNVFSAIFEKAFRGGAPSKIGGAHKKQFSLFHFPND